MHSGILYSKHIETNFIDSVRIQRMSSATNACWSNSQICRVNLDQLTTFQATNETPFKMNSVICVLKLHEKPEWFVSISRHYPDFGAFKWAIYERFPHLKSRQIFMFYRGKLCHFSFL